MVHQFTTSGLDLEGSHVTSRFCLWKELARWLTAVQCFQVQLQSFGNVCLAASHLESEVTQYAKGKLCCESSYPGCLSDLALKIQIGSVSTVLTPNLDFLPSGSRTSNDSTGHKLKYHLRELLLFFLHYTQITSYQRIIWFSVQHKIAGLFDTLQESIW